MRVTVCELGDSTDAFANDWGRLVAHVKNERSELVLLPEMPFCPWFALSRRFDRDAWQAAVAAHDRWIGRLGELTPAIVLGTRAVNRDSRRLNEAFAWSNNLGYRAVHHKYFLPNEDGFWEAEWYSRGDGTFVAEQCGPALVAFQICTELWALDQARTYGKGAVHVIATPRATPHSTLEKWLVGGRAAAVCSGAYSISSNHVSSAGDAVYLGGQGWIVGPDGDVLALTSREQPMATVDIDLTAAEQAKSMYPRYVF